MSGTVDLKTKFCANPFRRAELLIDGRVTPCCSLWVTHSYGDAYTQSLDDLWNSKAAQQMRESILNGSFEYCRKDLCVPILKGTLPDRDAVTDLELRAIIDGHELRVSDPPRELFLANDESCNLTCPSCRSGLLVASDEKKAHLETVAQDVIFPTLAAGRPIALSIAGQGDPWASPHYRSILRYLADHDCNVTQLTLYTNGVLLTEAVWNNYKGLEKYHPKLGISIDAASSEVYARLRRGDWNKLQTNLAFLGGLRQRGALGHFELNMTVQAENYFEMADMVRLAKANHCDAALFYLIQPTGDHLRGSYAAKNVAAPKHPEHGALLETLRDPIFADPIVQLYDIDTLRTRALTGSGVAGGIAQSRGVALSDEDLIALIDGFLGQGLADGALEVVAAAQTRLGQRALLHNLAGAALYMTGALDRAELHFDRALALEPNDLQSRLNVGLMKAETGQWAAALPILDGLPLETLDADTRAQVTQLTARARRQLPLVVAR